MRILHISPIFYPEASSGIVHVIQNIGPRLVKHGLDVVLICPNYIRDKNAIVVRSLKNYLGMKIWYHPSMFIPIGKNLNFYITPTMYRFDIKKIDIIHLHDFRSYQNIVAYKLSRKFKKPYVIHAHGALSLPFSWYRILFDSFYGWRILKDASKLIALSQREVEQYKQFGVSEDRTEIIPNGVDARFFYNLPSKGLFKKELGISNDYNLFLYIGRIHKYKGLDFLIRAYYHALKNYNLNKTMLVIAGPDSGYLNNLKTLIRLYNLKNKVILVGPLHGIKKVQAYRDALLTLSLDVVPAPFLLVPLESLASETPVVVTRNIYLSQKIEEEKIGFVVDYGNIRDLAYIMKYSIENLDLLNHMGKKGRIYVISNYNWDIIVQKLIKLYKELSQIGGN
ncbi:MAG: glycosyltransferase family 4 protein [Nitrososphaeria archaeon]